MFSKVVVLINKRVLCFRKYESNEFKKINKRLDL